MWEVWLIENKNLVLKEVVKPQTTNKIVQCNNKAVFLKCNKEIGVNKTTTPEFYRLYQQSILLELKEQGVLNEIQYQYCLDIINH